MSRRPHLKLHFCVVLCQLNFFIDFGVLGHDGSCGPKMFAPEVAAHNVSCPSFPFRLMHTCGARRVSDIHDSNGWAGQLNRVMAKPAMKIRRVGTTTPVF